MGLSPPLRAIISPVSRTALEATITAASLQQLKVEDTTSSLLTQDITSINLLLHLPLGEISLVNLFVSVSKF